MKAEQLQKFATELIGKRVTIYKKDMLIPEYQNQYQNQYHNYKITIETESIYGVCIDNVIEYDFKTGKKYDNILKTFVTQYINKYATKQVLNWDVDKCCFTYPDKKEVLNALKNNHRIHKYYFYTTLYGIGYFCYFMSSKAHDKAKKLLSEYLNSKKIDFKNEFSEARWVYRFLINKDVKLHNKLLENLEI